LSRVSKHILLHVIVSNFHSKRAIEAKKDRKSEAKHEIIKALDIEKLLINQCFSAFGRNTMSEKKYNKVCLSLARRRLKSIKISAKFFSFSPLDPLEPAIYNFLYLLTFSHFDLRQVYAPCEKQKQTETRQPNMFKLFAQLKHVVGGARAYIAGAHL
jgi:hypothetical protein